MGIQKAIKAIKAGKACVFLHLKPYGFYSLLFFMKYFFGILAIIIGCFLVIKTEWFIENFGRSDWAEDKLGSGGSHLFYKLIGVVFIILSILGMTGALGEIIISVFGGIFGLKQQ